MRLTTRNRAHGPFPGRIAGVKFRQRLTWFRVLVPSRIGRVARCRHDERADEPEVSHRQAGSNGNGLTEMQ